MEKIMVVKKSGEKEPYSDQKVLHSMQRVGLPQDLRSMVLQHIKERLHPDITTVEIFSHILEFLEQRDKAASVRFNLKKSIFDLGPTGFPFERYMERVFKAMRYSTAVDVIMEGACVNHEIDILLEKNGEKSIVEAKFHSVQGNKTDVQVMLYTYARFLDVKDKNNIAKVWVVTNTKLSHDAIAYAECKGMPVIAWNYPERGNLQDFVENPHLYPVTILNSLTTDEKTKLIADKIVLTCDLLDISDQELLQKYNITQNRLKDAKSSAEMVCK